jgi:hypothetical protein
MAIKIPIVTVFDNKGLKNAQSAIGKIGGGIKSIGKGLVVGGAAIAAVGALGVRMAKAAEEAQKANNRLDAVAKSMNLFGSETSQVTGRLKAFAEANELSLAVDADVIKATQTKLLTFANLAKTADQVGGSMDRATLAAIDLAAAGFGSAETNAIQLGKALQDPIKGITALARSGVTFTEQEKEKIKTLVESGKVLEAQNLILSAIETQVGGTAAATATSSAKMGLAFAAMQDSIGEALLPTFDEITKIITGTLTPLAQQLIPIFTSLFEALGPILEKLAPVIVELLSAIGPVFETLIKAVEPLLDAMMPLVDVLIMLVDALAPIIEAIMPIFIDLVKILAPVIAELAKALLPIIEALLPPLLKLFEALIPVIELLADILIDYILPVFNKLVEFALPPLIFLIERFTEGIENLTAFLGPLFEALKPVLDSLLAIAGIKPGDLDKKVRVNVRVESNARDSELDQYLGFLGGRAAQAGASGVGGTGFVPPVTTPTGGASGSAAARQASPLQQLITDSKKNATIVKKQSKLERKGLSAEVAQWVTTSNKPVKAANQAIQRITKNGNKAIANLTKAYTNSAAGQAAAAASTATTITQEFTAAYDDTADREAAALAERERVYKSFQDSVVATFAGIKNAILGAFDLTQLGGSTNAITRNMDKLLTRLRSFATNVTKLSGMGLDPALLQQVIAAGPLAGARLAQTLVAGGANALNSINAGFNEFGALSSQIAQTGTESLFNRQAQQTIYNIEVSGGVGSGATIGKAIVDAIKSYERTSGAVFQGA